MAVATQKQKLQSRRKIEDMIGLAASFPEIRCSEDQFNQAHTLLKVKNGTVDLETGELIESCRDHYITKCASVEYDSSAECPGFREFLNQTFLSEGELVDFVQRALGYSISGDTSEQKFFMCVGEGANGKSTFLNVIHGVLGNYGSHAPYDAFLRQRSSQTNYLASLGGVRFVTATETNQGVFMDEALLKQLTGEDVATVRALYHEYFSYHPQFKIWIATNHLPQIQETTHAMWRRIVVVPFNNNVPPQQIAKELQARLIAEGPGILNWLIDGYKYWKDEGLSSPDTVQDHVGEYKKEMDTVSHFIGEGCLQGGGYEAQSSQIYVAYKKLTKSNGAYPVSQKLFSTRLEKMGYKKEHKSYGNVFLGIKTITE